MLSYSSKFKKTCCGKIQKISTSSFKKSGHPNLELKSAPNTFVCCCQKTLRRENRGAKRRQTPKLSADSFRAQVSSSVDQRFKAGTLHNKYYCENFWQCFQQFSRKFQEKIPYSFKNLIGFHKWGKTNFFFVWFFMGLFWFLLLNWIFFFCHNIILFTSLCTDL